MINLNGKLSGSLLGVFFDVLEPKFSNSRNAKNGNKMFNFNIKIMNREIKNSASIKTVNQSIYYAPAASTRGDQVAIYRYAFEEQCAAYARDILNEQNALQQSVARYCFVKFILEHYMEYSGDRRELLRGAALMISLAFDTIYFTIISARASLNYYTRQLRKLKAAKKTKNQLAEIRGKIRKYQSLLNHYRSICPDHIAADIVRLNSELEQLR